MKGAIVLVGGVMSSMETGADVALNPWLSNATAANMLRPNGALVNITL